MKIPSPKFLKHPIAIVSIVLMVLTFGLTLHMRLRLGEMNRIQENGIASVRAATDLELAAIEIRLQLDRYLISGDQKMLDGVPELESKLQNSIVQMQRYAETPHEQELLTQIQAGFNNFCDEYHEVIDLFHNRAAYLKILTMIDAQLNNEVLKPVQECLMFKHQSLESLGESNKKFSNTMTLFLSIIAICSLLGGISGGYFLGRMKHAIRSTHKRLIRTAKILNRFANGKQDAMASQDGLSTMPGNADALKKMERTLAIVLKKLKKTERDALKAEKLAYVGQMAAGIAHEIRNPLMSIKLIVQNAADPNQRGTLSSRDLRVLEEEILRMEHIINTFLNFARPPRMEYSQVALAPLLKQTLEGISARAKKQNVRLGLSLNPEDIVFAADPRQLQQVLYNLFYNALDVQPAGGRIAVSARMERENNPDDAWLLITVADQGPGIDTSLGIKIFDAFVSNKRAGMGLGLSICKRIVESHGGRIDAMNKRKGGAVFYIHLPIQKPKWIEAIIRNDVPQEAVLA
ncbi:MAG: ATP-binding protein [Zavarzinella sp.]